MMESIRGERSIKKEREEEKENRILLLTLELRFLTPQRGIGASDEVVDFITKASKTTQEGIRYKDDRGTL